MVSIDDPQNPTCSLSIVLRNLGRLLGKRFCLWWIGWIVFQRQGMNDLLDYCDIADMHKKLRGIMKEVPKTGDAVLEVQPSLSLRRCHPFAAIEVGGDIADMHKKLRGIMKEMGGPAFPAFVPKTGDAVLEVQQSDLARVHAKICKFSCQVSEKVALAHGDIADMHKKLCRIMTEMGGPAFPAFVPKNGDAVLEVQQSLVLRSLAKGRAEQREDLAQTLGKLCGRHLASFRDKLYGGGCAHQENEERAASAAHANWMDED
ncbi:unnamed protein product [Symbiodinium sp. KB8]|nr:unnamed protein product [Symbiodinium sp. KB8]